MSSINLIKPIKWKQINPSIFNQCGSHFINLSFILSFCILIPCRSSGKQQQFFSWLINSIQFQSSFCIQISISLFSLFIQLLITAHWFALTSIFLSNLVYFPELLLWFNPEIQFINPQLQINSFNLWDWLNQASSQFGSQVEKRNLINYFYYAFAFLGLVVELAAFVWFHFGF